MEITSGEEGREAYIREGEVIASAKALRQERGGGKEYRMGGAETT